MLQYREKIQLPEARIECRLEFLDELAVSVLETSRPVIQHVAIEPVWLPMNIPEVRVLSALADNRRKEIYILCWHCQALLRNSGSIRGSSSALNPISTSTGPVVI